MNGKVIALTATILLITVLIIGLVIVVDVAKMKYECKEAGLHYDDSNGRSLLPSGCSSQKAGIMRSKNWTQ